MNQRKIEPFETPKILGDIFESVIGAVFEDGGLDTVHRVFNHLLSPLVLYNAQFSKMAAIYGEPKEQFQWKCHEHWIKPKYKVSESTYMQTIKSENMVFCEVEALMYDCTIIYRNGQEMCGSIGSTKRQAERNAAVMGLLWLDSSKNLINKNPNYQGRESAIRFIENPLRG